MIPVVACPDRQQLDSAFVSTSLYNKVEKKKWSAMRMRIKQN